MTANHLLLHRLSEIMLDHEQHILPVDLLFDDEQIGDFVKSIQIDSPYQQMLLEGVLTESVRDEKLYVSFTVEGYYHYVLGEVIYEQSQNKDHTYFVTLLDSNRLNGVKEGVEQCLIQEVNQGKMERLVSLIDAGGEAEQIACFPLVHAFMKNNVEDVFQILMEKLSTHDWNVIKHVRSILLGNQKQHIVDQLDGIIKESTDLKHTINALIQRKNENEFTEALPLISFYSDLNALDQAKEYYSQFIEEAEKRNDLESLVIALEELGGSEYKRSGQAGYKAAMSALTRALEIRESQPAPQKDKLKNTYRLLGFAYSSLGLQVVKSTEYFEKAKAIMLEESSDSVDLAEINLYIGLVHFWRGLRGIGRWGNADVKLLEGLTYDVFEYADSQFQKAYNYHLKNSGKTHPKTLNTLHYLQENRYALGNYEKAIPWLRLYVDALPFKVKEHTDNYYLYSLVVSLEEYAKIIGEKDPMHAMVCIDEAITLAKKYDEDHQITQRLLNTRTAIESGNIQEVKVPEISDLTELNMESRYTGIWSKWEYSDELTGFQTNNWLNDNGGLWFFHGGKGALVYWNRVKNLLESFHPKKWPGGCGRVVMDPQTNTFYAWSSIKSEVYQLSDPNGKWIRLSYGVHDVHACGASYGYDPIHNRLFEFGGYGYFTYKNWLWCYDLEQRKWIQVKENKPGIGPYPRNGQILPIGDGSKVLLISGIGSDTGIQREHKARMGLASATDVGYFTWLRDAWELDLRTLEWKQMLDTNHESIHHEGAMGYIQSLDLVVNWAGSIPNPRYGQEIQKVFDCSVWDMNSNEGFNKLNLEYVNEKPEGDGYFVSIHKSNKLIYIMNNNIFNFELRTYRNTQINK